MREILKREFRTIAIGLTVIAFLTAFCFFVGYSLVIPLLLAVLGIHLTYIRKASVKRFLHVGLLLSLIVFSAHALQEYTSLSPYYIPVASIVMLAMLLFNDLQLSFILSFAGSVLVVLTVGGGLHDMLIFFVGSLIGAYTIRDARTRGKIINAGIFVGVMQVFAAFLLDPHVTGSTVTVFYQPLMISGLLSAGIVFPTLKIFETLFGELTNFSLLELADSSNQPLLKRMVIEAPGTYHHSLIVSNLSEAAAEAIGANGLLARVGAYYHDIGKMEKSDYFTENQMMTGNKHDRLEPSMSRLVILNHVKEGVELAKKHKLNPQIIKFIPEHHGTSLMYFFYQKALEEADNPGDVKEENYRYPGPKPQSRETAVVLLADSVEGATRALDEHTPNKIDEVVRKIVNNKFIDGQLDDCSLTLRDLELISNTFTRVLSAMYHGRVKYPEKKKNGHNGKKPAEKSPDQPEPDQDNGLEDTQDHRS